MSSELIEQGVAHQLAGHFPEAEAIYRRILDSAPRDALALHWLGMLAGQRGQPVEAIEFIGQAIEIAPHVSAFHNNLANVLREAGQLEKAVDAYRRAIQLDPQFAHAQVNLAMVLSGMGRFDEAVAAYSRALELDPKEADEIRPDYAKAHNDLGVALQKSERLDDAILSYRRAIEIQPGYAEAYSNLGTAFKDAGHFDQARDTLRQAIQLAPDLAEAHCNLGVALADSGYLEEALDSLRRAIQLRPGYAEAHINLGVVLCNQGHAQESIRACTKAVELQPELEAARLNFAQVLLTQGNFELGWVEYERRWIANPRIRNGSFSQPRWTGESLIGKTILLHAEQGLGDAIHFVRYAPLVAARGGHVLLECQPELVRLFQTVEGVDQVIAVGQPPPEFDLHCPLMSLPLVMRTTLRSIPANIPYLQSETWNEKLDGPQDDLKVGLVWAGRPTHSNDRNRSMKLAEFSRLSHVPGITFHTLQKGAAAAEALSPPPGLHLVDHAAQLHDFVDTASLISTLDLVISVDSSVAHLAGALGKPVWVLLPYVPDWRWMRDRTDSPWYPTMRLFRQSRWGSWTEPLAQLATCLIRRREELLRRR
jgi:tetratricopeptide (TPR) repeat protein